MTAAELEAEVQARLSSGEEKAKLHQEYLGRKGKLTAELRALKELPVHLRRSEGQALNQLKIKLEAALIESVQSDELPVGWSSNIPSWNNRKTGHLHPETQFLRRIIIIFNRMGFQLFEGNEIETTDYNFDRLNIPTNHPARDVQDTFYLVPGSDETQHGETDLVLRTHVSNMQTRIVSAHPPPIRAMYPGRVFRNEATDARHLAAFFQFETLVIEPGISLRHLLWTLNRFAEDLVGGSARARFRPSYFPFTEPSLEVDITCLICHGQGCRVCAGSGWVESGGAGMIHPRVLENMGLDPAKHQGFAFGMGFDRLLMMAARIPDIRLLVENDIRFLRQF